MAESRNNTRIKLFEGATAAECEEQANAWITDPATGDVSVTFVTLSVSSKAMLTTYNYRGFQKQDDTVDSPGAITDKIVLAITYELQRR